jgi:hypothetical protein
MSFLGLEGLHVFVTGAAGGIGGQAVKEFLGIYSFLLTYTRTDRILFHLIIQFGPVGETPIKSSIQLSLQVTPL